MRQRIHTTLRKHRHTTTLAIQTLQHNNLHHIPNRIRNQPHNILKETKMKQKTFTQEYFDNEIISICVPLLYGITICFSCMLNYKFIETNTINNIFEIIGFMVIIVLIPLCMIYLQYLIVILIRGIIKILDEGAK